MIESYWLVHILGSAPVPVGETARNQIESALTEKGIELIYFTDIFDSTHCHIVPREAIKHLEYSNPELRQRRARHNAEIYHQAGQAYFERRSNALPVNALGLATFK